MNPKNKYSYEIDSDKVKTSAIKYVEKYEKKCYFDSSKND
jgi:hypothetical protein